MFASVPVHPWQMLIPGQMLIHNKVTRLREIPRQQVQKPTPQTFFLNNLSLKMLEIA